MSINRRDRSDAGRRFQSRSARTGIPDTNSDFQQPPPQPPQIPFHARRLAHPPRRVDRLLISTPIRTNHRRTRNTRQQTIANTIKIVKSTTPPPTLAPEANPTQQEAPSPPRDTAGSAPAPSTHAPNTPAPIQQEPPQAQTPSEAAHTPDAGTETPDAPPHPSRSRNASSTALIKTSRIQASRGTSPRTSSNCATNPGDKRSPY
jgi:hypothetical protein